MLAAAVTTRWRRLGRLPPAGAPTKLGLEACCIEARLRMVLARAGCAARGGGAWAACASERASVG